MPSRESIHQETTWVVLPNGLSADGKQAVCSVFVAPKLVADDVGGPPRLSDFPDWVDWPARLGEASFHFGRPDEEPVAATVLPSTASSELWKLLFPPTTAVEPFTGNDLSQHPVMTYSVPEVAESMRQSYTATTMDAMDGLPQMDMAQALTGDLEDMPFGDMFQAMGNNRFLMAPDDEFARGFEERLAAARDAMAAGDEPEVVEVMQATEEPGSEVARLLAYHRGKVTATRSGEPDPAEAQRLGASFDFHKILSALAEHPALLRRLGLVFDLALPVSAVEGDETGVIRVIPTWRTISVGPDAVVGEDTTPFTFYAFQRGSPAPFTTVAGMYPPGFLNLGHDRFQVEQLDVDAAVEKAAAMVQSLLSPMAAAEPVEAESGESGDSADSDDSVDSGEIEREIEVPPVEAGPTEFNPPALRTSGLILVDADRVQETYGVMAAAAAVDDDLFGSADEPLHAEDVTRGYRLDVYDEKAGAWRSLHVRTVRYLRDGKEILEPVQDEGWFEVSVTGPPVEPGTEPDPASPIYMNQAFVHWDGWSLSAPRPGRSLSLLGGGTDPDRPETAPQRVSNEPLTSTGLQIEVSVTPGTLPKLRFGHTYRLRVRTVDLAGNGLDLPTADEVAALAKQETADLGLDGWDTRPVTFLRLEPVPPPVLHRQASGRAGEADHRLVIRSGLDPDVDLGAAPDRDECLLLAPKGAVDLVERHGKFDGAIGSTNRTRHRRSYELAARESASLPEGAVDEVPYLPDPLARGITIVGLPGMAASETFKVRWEADPWHQPKPVKLRLVSPRGGGPSPAWDAGKRTITVPLAAARQVSVRVSSLLQGDPPLGLLEWSRAVLSPAQYDRLRDEVLDSRHVMFTPWQDVELVHAVQRPLVAPDLDAGPAGGAGRSPGDTDYRFPGSTVPDPYSTASLDLVARWEEWTDDPRTPMHRDDQGNPPAWTREMSVEVGSVPVQLPAEGKKAAPLLKFYDERFDLAPLQFSDTRHRMVTWQARAISRFAEYFPAELARQPGRLSIEGSTVKLSVPSTARPPVPVILDVVPTTAIVVDKADPAVRRREGGWLRVYAARPWYVTGEGEQLGVVVPYPGPSGPEAPHYPVSSLLGGDLAHYSDPPTPLDSGQIGNATGKPRDGVQLPEIQELQLVARDVRGAVLHGFEPHFDEAGQRWYFDIHIGQAGYFPMVRLAVVRYQEHSIAGEEPLSPHHYMVSPVVALEPVPLLPDRRLRVDRPKPGRLQLTLSGPTYDHILDLDGSQNDRPEAQARVTAQVQERRGRSLTPSPDDDWVTVATHPFHRLDQPADGHDAQWQLTLELDMTAPAKPGKRRLLIVEEDRLATDPAAGLTPAPAVGYEADYSRRLVYADTIEIGRPVARRVEESPSERTHVVQRNENLSVIGQKHGVPWKKIAELNGIEDPYVIHPGQVLRLPPA